MTLAAVADAGPLIHLAEVDAIDLLSTFDTLLVPEQVYSEIERGGVPDSLSGLSYDVVTADSKEVAPDSLDPGERSALSVASDRDVILLTDDLDAREQASDEGIEVHGSIGIIALGYTRDRLSQDDAASLMRALQEETSLFVTDAVVERGIRLLEES
ncbi:MAG: nucleic acid-binding protein [Haloarculaceae archaeon]